MEFWKKLSEALKEKGFSATQIKKIQEMFGHLDAAGLLLLTPDQLLAAMTGRTVAEKKKKAKILQEAVRDITHDPGHGDTSRTILPVRAVESRLGRLLTSKRGELEKTNIANSHDLRKLGRQSASRIREAGFTDDERKVIGTFAELSRIFPPAVAVALFEAEANGLDEIIKWSENKFMAALELTGINTETAKFEYKRLQRLEELSVQENGTGKITGLRLDLGKGVNLNASDSRTLNRSGIETLADWAVLKDNTRLTDDSRALLDSYVRLYYVGIHGDTAEKFRKGGLGSSLELSRLSNDLVEKKATEFRVDAGTIYGARALALSQVSNVLNVLDDLMVPSDDGPLSWVGDITMLYPIKFCVECDSENSAFSRFAYFVYLIQRTGITPDILEPEILDGQLRNHLLEVFSVSDDPTPVPDGSFLKNLSYIKGNKEVPDPLATCNSITLTNLLIRKLQEYLDKLQANRPNTWLDYSYNSYEVWRSERLAHFFPELNALWRDDVLTGGTGVPSRGSILFDPARTRPFIQENLKKATEAIDGAHLRRGENDNAGEFILESPPYYSSFQNGLRVIDNILSADTKASEAVNALDADQPGLAMAFLREAQASLNMAADLVFEKTSPWVSLSSTDKTLEDIIINLPASTRRLFLTQLFEELMYGPKRLFRPGLVDHVVNGLNASGIIDISNLNWHVEKFVQHNDGVKRKPDTDGNMWLRYNAGNEFENYKVGCDFVLEKELIHNDRFGIGIRVAGDNNSFSNKGYRAEIRCTTVSLKTLHRLHLRKAVLNSNGNVTWEDLTDPVEIGFYAGGTGTYNTNDTDRKLLETGVTYHLSLSCVGSEIKTSMRRSATRTIQIEATSSAHQEGTFGFFGTQKTEVIFKKVEVNFEGKDSKAPPPFYVNRKIDKRDTLDDRVYLDIVNGTGFTSPVNGDIPLVTIAQAQNVIPLYNVEDLNNKSLSLIFSAGSPLPDLYALDVLLERMLAGMFYLRFVVIPVRLARAYQQSGDFASGARQYSMIYDDLAPGGENNRRIFPFMSLLPEGLNFKAGPDARLIRLRLGELLLEWAEWLFRQDTPETLHQSRRLYERVKKLHRYDNCNCEAQLGTVTEAIVDRSLEMGADIPEKPGLMDDPDRIGSLLDSIFDLGKYGGYDIDSLINYLNNPDTSNINPSPETSVSTSPEKLLERLGEHLEFLGNEYREVIDKMVSYGPLMERGDILIMEAETRVGQGMPGMPGMGNDPVMLFSTFPGVNWNFVTSGENSQYTNREFLYPAFCVPHSPLRSQQVKTACLMLDLINSCRNILGFDKSFVPPLRFEALLRISRNFTDQAHAMERDLLQTRQSFEQYTLSLMEAENNLLLSRGDAALESMNLELSRGELRMSVLQFNQSQHSVDHYDKLIEDGWSDAENLAFGLLIAAGSFQSIGAVIGAAGGVVAASAADWGTSGGFLQGAGGIIGAAGGLILSGGGGLSTFSAAASMYASFERREQEWKFQHEQGQYGLQIAGEGLSQAALRVEIAHRRREIAELRSQFAADGVRFLSHKFMNREMWVWLKRTIDEQYRIRLNYGIAAGYMAERALAFELQNNSLRMIRFNYFNPARDGLLGATQLQTDISGLENTKLSFSKQKLQLTKTISLARVFPVEFERFRSGAGSLHFSTASGDFDPGQPEESYSMELFDREFPGHYMRLIRSVRVTVVALIPPHDGIRASLRNSGISRVVVGPPYSNEFREETVTRNSESIALSSPFQSSGMFNLDSRDDLLLPFEGLGVATDWIFELPRAANSFDYRTIADVLVTIDYTALESPVYRQHVIQKLPTTLSLDKPFSFRHQFADAWYDLNNPDLVHDPQKPMEVFLATGKEDFPPNLDNLTIEHVSLFIARKYGVTEEVNLDLKFTRTGSPAGPFGGAAVTSNGVASTRQDTLDAWDSIKGEPFGEWTLAFEDDPDDPAKQKMRNLLKAGQVDDILFVITFNGKTAGWPA